jgi:protein gp37
MTRLLSGWILPTNLWLGVSIESNRYVFRADHLRDTLTAVKFVSAEPLLGPLTELNLDGIDWVIAGGESGHGARPMHPSWAGALRDRCAGLGVAFFFKQWGAWAPVDAGTPLAVPGRRSPRTNEAASHVSHMLHVGKASAGRRLDGRTWDEMPTRRAPGVTTNDIHGDRGAPPRVGRLERVEDRDRARCVPASLPVSGPDLAPPSVH